MNTLLKSVLAGTAVVAGALGTIAAVGSPAGASVWLNCAAGTSRAYDGAYTSYTFGNGELRFQACRTVAGDVDRTKVAYVKRHGGPVEVALGWQWVTASGTPYVTEAYGGGSPDTYHVSAGETATLNGPYHWDDGTVDLYGNRPSSGQFTCIRGAMWTGESGDETYTPQACF